MPFVEMKLAVCGVRLIGKGIYSPSTVTTFGRSHLQHLTLTSVRLADTDVDLIDLLSAPTLESVERAMRIHATRRLNRPAAAAPREGVTRG